MVAGAWCTLLSGGGPGMWLPVAGVPYCMAVELEYGCLWLVCAEQDQAWVLAVSATAVGRTGEPLRASCAVAVGPTLSVLSFSLSMPDPIPGQPFSPHPVVEPLRGPPAGADFSCPATGAPGLRDGTAASHPPDLPPTAEVTFTLARLEGGQQAGGDWSLTSLKSCHVTDPTCSFLLPRAGEYGLTGCVRDSAGDKSCATMRLGRPEEVRKSRGLRALSHRCRCCLSG